MVLHGHLHRVDTMNIKFVNTMDLLKLPIYRWRNWYSVKLDDFSPICVLEDRCNPEFMVYLHVCISIRTRIHMHLHLCPCTDIYGCVRFINRTRTMPMTLASHYAVPSMAICILIENGHLVLHSFALLKEMKRWQNKSMMVCPAIMSPLAPK